MNREQRIGSLVPNKTNRSHSFEKRLLDTGESILFDLHEQNAPVLIAFGGFAGAMGLPPFEFFQLTHNYPTGKIYIRDLTQTWYQKGIPGVAPNMEELARFLKKTLGGKKPSKLVLVGNSMGGYAAIVMGVLLNADVVHAFSPQTFIDSENRARYRDRRWAEQIENIYALQDCCHLDLRTFLSSRRKFNGTLNLYYSKEEEMDAIHAERLRGLYNVRLHCFTEGGHSLIKHLRDNGSLAKIIVESLGCRTKTWKLVPERFLHVFTKKRSLLS